MLNGLVENVSRLFRSRIVNKGKLVLMGRSTALLIVGRHDHCVWICVVVGLVKVWFY
jgi:hypothetical protein